MSAPVVLRRRGCKIVYDSDISGAINICRNSEAGGDSQNTQADKYGVGQSRMHDDSGRHEHATAPSLGRSEASLRMNDDTQRKQIVWVHRDERHLVADVEDWNVQVGTVESADTEGNSTSAVVKVGGAKIDARISIKVCVSRRSD